MFVYQMLEAAYSVLCFDRVIDLRGVIKDILELVLVQGDALLPRLRLSISIVLANVDQRHMLP